jgi:hypothetical protein
MEVNMPTLDAIRALPRPPRPPFGMRVVIAVLLIVFLLFMGPFRTIPAGHVGVKDFFGQVSASTLPPGIRLVVPFTQVVRMSVQTQEIKEVADVPSQEGLILNLETSVLFQLDPARAAEIYRTVGTNYVNTILEPQFRSAIREVTASTKRRRSTLPSASALPPRSRRSSAASPARAASSSSRCCSGRSGCRRWSRTRFRRSCGASRKPNR